MERNAFLADGTERTFFAAGDRNQNAPIARSPLCLTREETKAYYLRAISTIFPHHITLRVCKRIKTDKERATLIAIKDAVLHTDEPLITIARRYFKCISDLNAVQGMAVCYMNDTARIVNTFHHKRVLESLDTDAILHPPDRASGRTYYIGQRLRGRASSSASAAMTALM